MHTCLHLKNYIRTASIKEISRRTLLTSLGAVVLVPKTLGLLNPYPIATKKSSSQGSRRWMLTEQTHLSDFKLSSHCCAVLCHIQSRSKSEMATQDELVDELVAEGIVTHHNVEQALRTVDRRIFSGHHVAKAHAYIDTPLPIGYGETISAPHMHATCLEMLHHQLGNKPGARVLDVGSGSGYLTAAFAIMVGPTGYTLGIEKHPELAEESIQNINNFMPELLQSGRVEIRAGNVLGRALDGVSEPFDAIHVGAAAEEIPQVLIDLLKPGGRLVVPVGPHGEYQVMQMIDKDAQGNIHKKDSMYVRYVPLTKPTKSEE